MDVKLNGLAFRMRAAGWGSQKLTEEALSYARERLRNEPTADLEQVAVDAAAELRCLRGSFILRPVQAAVGAIEEQLVAALRRPAAGTVAMTAKDLARRLRLRMDVGTLRALGAALRRHVGDPRRSNGETLWDFPNVWRDE